MSAHFYDSESCISILLIVAQDPCLFSLQRLLHIMVFPIVVSGPAGVHWSASGLAMLPFCISAIPLFPSNVDHANKSRT